jgi:hypothetical protein
MRARLDFRFLFAIVVLGAATASEASPTVVKAPIHQVTGVTIVPGVPEPDESVHVRIEGNGTCKVWLGIKRLDADTSGLPPVRWNPLDGINDVTRAPDTTLALPGELPAIKLGAGRWKIAVDSHEGFKGSNCKGGAIIEFQVARKAPSVLARQGVAPAGALGSGTTSAPAANGQAAAGGSMASASIHQVTAVSVLPSAPQPDEPFRVRVEGNGTCKVWLSIKRLDGGAPNLPNGWNPTGLINEYSRTPDATLALPGEIPAPRLGAGRWKIVADPHEGFKGSTCTGGANVDFQVAAKAPVLLQRKP